MPHVSIYEHEIRKITMTQIHDSLSPSSGAHNCQNLSRILQRARPARDSLMETSGCIDPMAKPALRIGARLFEIKAPLVCRATLLAFGSG